MAGVAHPAALAWRRASRAWGWPLALALTCALLAGCASLSSASTPLAAGGGPAPTATATGGGGAAACAQVVCAPGGIAQASVFVEPDAGTGPVLQAIEGANHAIDLEMYLLTDTTIIHALEDAAGRGVSVRVLLELHPYGGGATAAQRTLDELSAAGVETEGADPAYHYTHAKAMVIDDATAYIMTCNFTKSGLGGSSYTANREYGVIDTQSADVAEVERVFQADWTRTQPALGDANLVISPVDSRDKIGALLDQTTTSLDVEDEEMYDSASVDALINAARRGVRVEVVLPPSADSGDGASEIDALRQGGVQVRLLGTPYMHAKLIIVDGKEAFVGSENFSSTSLDENREIGVLLADPASVGTLEHVFGLDWAAAR